MKYVQSLSPDLHTAMLISKQKYFRKPWFSFSIKELDFGFLAGIRTIICSVCCQGKNETSWKGDIAWVTTYNK